MAKETLQELHQQEIAVLQVFHDFCEEHHLTYYLFFGSLLGAVRHKGFIPWDVDIDVLMPRADYAKLLQLFPKENKVAHVGLASIDTIPEYHLPFARVHNLHSKKFVANPFLRKPYRIGPWVDIYSLDNVGDDIAQANRFIKEVNFWSRLSYWRSCKVSSLKKPKYILRALVSQCMLFLSTSFFVRRVDKLCQRYAADTFTKYVFNVCHTFGPSNKIMPREWFEKRELHAFENRQFYIPSAWHEILTQLYGDYMTPVKTGGHMEVE